MDSVTNSFPKAVKASIFKNKIIVILMLTFALALIMFNGCNLTQKSIPDFSEGIHPTDLTRPSDITYTSETTIMANYITVDEALNIAYNAAGIESRQISNNSVSLFDNQQDYGVQYYSITFEVFLDYHKEAIKYHYIINAYNGSILERNVDPVAPEGEPEVKITEEEATQIVLNRENISQDKVSSVEVKTEVSKSDYDEICYKVNILAYDKGESQYSYRVGTDSGMIYAGSVLFKTTEIPQGDEYPPAKAQEKALIDAGIMIENAMDLSVSYINQENYLEPYYSIKFYVDNFDYKQPFIYYSYHIGAISNSIIFKSFS